MNLSPDAWRYVCNRLLAEAGHVRLHDIRDGLNVAALGAELLDLPPGAGTAGVAQAAGSVKRSVTAVTHDVDGLHALIREIALPTPRILSDAVDWALQAAGPIARRRRLEIAIPFPVDRLAPLPVPDGFSLLVALVLAEAFSEAPRQSVCLVEATTDAGDTMLGIEWRSTPQATAHERACGLLSSALGDDGCAALTTSGGRRRIQIHWTLESAERQNPKQGEAGDA